MTTRCPADDGFGVRRPDGCSSIPRPDLNRVEYRLVVTERGGEHRASICDPANPERVATAFGERSVALMPGYERPAWLRSARPVPGRYDRARAHTMDDPDDDITEVPVTLWRPDGLTRRAGHRCSSCNDGPEYAELASARRTYAASADRRRVSCHRSGWR